MLNPLLKPRHEFDERDAQDSEDPPSSSRSSRLAPDYSVPIANFPLQHGNTHQTVAPLQAILGAGGRVSDAPVVALP